MIGMNFAAAEAGCLCMYGFSKQLFGFDTGTLCSCLGYADRLSSDVH